MRATILVGVLFGVVALFGCGSSEVRPDQYPRRDLGNLWKAVDRDSVGMANDVSRVLGLVAPIKVRRSVGYRDVSESFGVELVDSRGGSVLVVLAGDMSDSRTGHVFVGDHPANPGSEEVEPGSDRERAIATALVFATRRAETSRDVEGARRMASVLIGRKAD
ncbi:MAG: hypothetical protein R3E97_19840 [Candidatus Eisenbacteria bacterium]